MIQATIIDNMGIPRGAIHANDKDAAIAEVAKLASEYGKERPDLVPLSAHWGLPETK